MKLTKFRLISFLLSPIMISIELPSFAQIIPDRTVGTTVTPNVEINGLPSDRIEEGTIRDSNLFHSFQEFNIESGRGVYFSNPEGITNIFSRITGNNPSNINGILGVLGNANLFLLNPNGIIFSPNARLDLNGSFIGTTASSIKFADGVEFSATNPSGTALLTVSVPIGLQMGQNPGAITVQNTGHRLISSGNPIASNLDRSNNPVGLSVISGNTLALVGGEIDLDGGVLNAPSGNIELGSASNGTVNLNTSSPIWSFDYGNIQQFGDIQLSRLSLADASGTPGGSIHFQGRNISLNDGSAALVIHQGSGNSGDISVNASESLELRGLGTNEFSQSRLRIDNFSNNPGGNIVVSAPQIFLQDGGAIHTFNFGTGIGGNISLEIRDLLQMVGRSPIDGLASSLITNTSNSGKSGDIQVVTNRLQMLDGAVIGNLSVGIGAGGNTAIQAFDSIEVSGENQNNVAGSLILASAFNQGYGGQLTINTPKLRVTDGGGIVASTVNSGNGGDLEINVSDTIEVSGVGRFSGLPSRIGARAELFAPPLRRLLRLPDTITGNTGKLIINTPSLQVTNGAIVGVDHQGIGNAGNLQINANSVFLDKGGSIAASTLSGEGGSLDIRTHESLLVRHGSAITATAGGTGNGGNIIIETPTIVGLENSDITANALQGRGGNIQIATQGIFLSPDSDITASSQLGVSGTVNISILNLNSQNVAILPTNTFVNQVPVIASSCLNQRNAQQGRFVVTGNGGLSETPDNTLMPYEAALVRTVGQLQGRRNSIAETTNSSLPGSSIQEVTGFVFTSDGKVALVVANGEIASPTELTCSN